MAWSQAERQPLLSNDERRELPTPYRSIDNGTLDDSDQPLITRRGHPAALPSHKSARSTRNASAFIVRVYAVCPDIHCPSCISHLSSLVASLDIHPSCRIAISSADTSLIHRTVTIDLEVAPANSDVGAHAPQGSHGPARAAAKRLRRILEELARILAQDGFSVDHMRSKVIAGPEADHAYKQGLSQMLDASDLYRRPETSAAASSLPDMANASTKGSSMLGALPASLGNTLRSAWSRSAAGDTESARIHHERWRRHVQVCRACRNGDADHASPLQNTSSLPQQQDDDEPKDADDSHRRVVAVLSIAGMTCSSCAQSITNAVGAQAPQKVDSIKVDVLSASATLTAHPSALPSIIEAIDDAGFEAHLVKSEPVRSSSADRQRDEPDEHTWKARLAVHGMTCASCVQSVSSALQSYADETNAAHAVQIVTTSVDLMSKSADIVLSAPDKAQVEARLGELVTHVQDVGFDAELLTLQPESGKARAASDGAVFRHVRIEVQGMFCQSCVAKVRGYFSRLRTAHASDIDISDENLDGFTLAQPLLNFSYRSGSPSRLRLRTVLDEVNQLDPTFSARYAPPPSLASRSAVLARAELRDLLIRLAITAFFALPALAISMIAPLLSRQSALRRWTAAYVVGRATRGEVAMWLLATPVQFGVGALFLGKAWRSVSAMWKRRRSWTDRFLRFGNMDVLVALGTLVAYTSSLVLLGLDALRTPLPPAQEAQMDMTYFEVSVFLVLFILLGRVLEAVTKRKTGDAVAELGRMKPRTAQLLLDPSEPTSSRTQNVDVDLLDVGDLVLVPHGASPPLDGVVVGTTATPLFDESSLSGEARPVAKQVGEQVYAGTLNVSHSAVVVQVRVVPGACVIDDILDVVHEAAGKKARIAQLADAITGVFVPAIVYVSLAVLTVWSILLYSGMLGEDWQRRHVEHYGEPGARFVYALQFAIACLLVACPCGIGLAAPTSQLAGIGLASQHGILVNGGGEAFRAASTAADSAGQLVVVLDKTGTITKGDAVAVADHRFAAAQDQELQETQLLHCIELVEQASTHPYARAVRAWIAERSGATPPQPSPYILEDVVEVPGKGVRATFRRASEVDGRATSFVLLVGNRALMRELGAETQDSLIADAEREWSAASHSVVYVGMRWDSAPGAVALALAMSDEIRPEAAWVIAHLSSRYAAEVWMVTGDNAGTALSVAAQVGIPASRVVAGVLPIDKKTCVERLSSSDPESSLPARRRRWFNSARGRTVLFVGDGINDSPALSAANVGVALGSGSSIAHSSADFILLARTAPLLSIPVLLQLSRATHRKVTSNFAWAFVFNAVLIPVAAGALVGWGLTMGPELSGLAMAFSSTSVVLNSLSLRLWRPSRQLAKQLESK